MSEVLSPSPLGGIEALRNRRVGVWGTGREGREIARLALDRGASVQIVRDPPAVGDDPAEIDISGTVLKVALPSSLEETPPDILVRSPGVSRYRPELVALRRLRIPVTTATALWFEDFSGSRVVGVTGSKGKTMTASLAGLAVASTGVKVSLGGNIGTPVTDFYEAEVADAYVIEVSSFQAAEVAASPQVGVLTLLAPDHLDWHGTYERYVSDKLNLFAHRSSIDVAVNARSEAAVRATETFASRHLYGSEGRVTVRDDQVCVDGEPVVSLEGSALRGRHNLDNLCGAVVATELLVGAVPEFGRLGESMASMPVLPSRLETVAVVDGVEFVNDALASNPSGSVAALEAFEGRRVVLIAGGFDRGTDFSVLVRALDTRDEISVVHVGEAGARLVAELAASTTAVPCTPASDMADAVRRAIGAVEGTDAVVLFSPGSPTPPEEGTYVERSEVFRSTVDEYRSARC